MKKGDLEGAARIAKGTLGISGAGVRHGAGNELSLIDLGGIEESGSEIPARTQSNAGASNGHGLENDLLGLSMQEGDQPVSLGGPSLYGCKSALVLDYCAG